METNGSHTGTGKGSVDEIDDGLFGGGSVATAEKTELKTLLGTAAGTSTPYLTEQRAARDLADMYVPSTRPATHNHETGTGDIHEDDHYHGATPYGIVAPSSESETPHHTEAAAAFHNFMKQGYIRPIDLSASNTPEINLHSGAGGSVGAIGLAYRKSWALPQLDATGKPIVDAMGEQETKRLGPMEAPMWHSGTFGVDKDAWSFKTPREEASNLTQLQSVENPNTPGINYTLADAQALIQKVKETGSISHIPSAVGGTFTTNSLRQTATAHRVGFLMGSPDGKGKHIAVEWDPSAHGGAGQYVAGMGHDASNGGLLKFDTSRNPLNGDPVGHHGSEASMGHEGLQHHLALMSRIMPPSALVQPDASHPSGYRPYGVNVNDAWQRTSSGTVLPGSRNFVSDAVNVHLHAPNPQGVGLGFVKVKAGGMTDDALDAAIVATKGKGYHGVLTDEGKTNTALAAKEATDASSKLHVDTPEVRDAAGAITTPAIPADEKVHADLANRAVGINSVNTSKTP